MALSLDLTRSGAPAAWADEAVDLASNSRFAAFGAEQSLHLLERVETGFLAFELLEVGVGMAQVGTAETPEERAHATQALAGTLVGLAVEKVAVHSGLGPFGVAAGLYARWAITDPASFAHANSAPGRGMASVIERAHPGCGATDSCPNPGMGKR